MEGKGGTGSVRGGREGRNEAVGKAGEGRGETFDIGSVPLETSSGSAPASHYDTLIDRRTSRR